eukprot:CAMPEP_0177370056 /NCGR_PEP_ID=MMETSP0368-20130122/41779_1 /TAXON_ID=447022 ORGANISM="Scrippsiella hangoei-like, Strain SHHI-4" /NCGR_SAMPLE_ID=MMETSP0368 /ASSEMBLY_ACC=CAM_ASM_000363 /LENGTH=172 /DNA_ID=CAMNT_0018833277 /DNA_START=6 /DNA_END=520 /DNA_ORIENTATION=-
MAAAAAAVSDGHALLDEVAAEVVDREGGGGEAGVLNVRRPVAAPPSAMRSKVLCVREPSLHVTPPASDSGPTSARASARGPRSHPMSAHRLNHSSPPASPWPPRPLYARDALDKQLVDAQVLFAAAVELADWAPVGVKPVELTEVNEQSAPEERQRDDEQGDEPFPFSLHRG